MKGKARKIVLIQKDVFLLLRAFTDESKCNAKWKCIWCMQYVMVSSQTINVL